MFKLRHALSLVVAVLAMASTSHAGSKDHLYCDVFPNNAFPDQVCAKNKATGQCTVSWHFKDDNITKSKQKQAMDSCQRYLGKVVTNWNPANYYCDVFPNAAYPTEVCAKSKTTGQCTQSWHFSNDDINKTKQKLAFARCEQLLGKAITKWNPANYYCDTWPNDAFPDQVCAKSKSTGQCTHSWKVAKHDPSKKSLNEAFRRCNQLLGQ